MTNSTKIQMTGFKNSNKQIFQRKKYCQAANRHLQYLTVVEFIIVALFHVKFQLDFFMMQVLSQCFISVTHDNRDS